MCGMTFAVENRSTRGKSCPTATLPTTDPPQSSDGQIGTGMALPVSSMVSAVYVKTRRKPSFLQTNAENIFKIDAVCK
jgi:hypothetical protein